MRWEQRVARVTGTEIRSIRRNHVCARLLLPLKLDPNTLQAAFAQLDQAGDRMSSDVHMPLSAGGRAAVSVPVTDDTRAYAYTHRRQLRE